MTARDEILQRIRKAVPTSATEEPVARTYRLTGSLTAEQRLELFRQRLHDYGSTVHLCEMDGVAACVGEVLLGRTKRMIVIPPDLPSHWLPSGITFVRDEGLSFAQLDKSEGVLTACTVGIATTGTIVLQEGLEQGRRALTLVPDYHLCIVRAEQIVETVPEAFQVLLPGKTCATTFISGPSATSDIEMTRIKGVHGPRILEVIVVI